MEKQEFINKSNEHLSAIEGLNKLRESTLSVDGPSIKEILSTPEGKERFLTKKIILAGPPRSGKSCLREGLKKAIINNRYIDNEIPYPYMLTACPDGEGSWFQETMNSDSDLAAKLKNEYKSKFTPEFVRRISESVKKLSSPHNPLNFIDIGGIISTENQQICEGGNGAIIICGETSVACGKPAEWKEFFNQLNIPIIAELYSDYTGEEDFVSGVEDDGVFRGSVHHLERGENLNKRETIQALAKFIINFNK
jgi:CRISPR-associated protein Csx3